MDGILNAACWTLGFCPSLWSSDRYSMGQSTVQGACETKYQCEAGDLIGPGAVVVVIEGLALELQPHRVGELEAMCALAFLHRPDRRVPVELPDAMHAPSSCVDKPFPRDVLSKPFKLC